MNRIPIKSSCLLVLLVLLCAGACVGAEPTQQRRPNILLIMADDLGWSDLGCYGGEVRTPHLDALSAGGLRFTQFYNGTRCCPTRASLLTGLYPHQAGVGHMTTDAGPKFPGYRGFLQPDCVTIAQVLKAAGYRTYHSGKWHLTKKSDPHARGFDEAYSMIEGFREFWNPGAFVRLPPERKARTYEPGRFYSTDAITDHALDFLADARTAADKPFFLYLACTAPHFPLHALADDIARYKDHYAQGWDRIREQRLARQKELGLIPRDTPLAPRSHVTPNWANVQSPYRNQENPAWATLDADRRADLARRMAVYAAMVDRMDRNIGRVRDDLKKHGQLENTLILFLSDNGACAEWDPLGFDGKSGPDNVLHKGADLDRMGGPGTYHSYGSGWANACNTPWRLYKHYCHEGGIRTPLIAHWPAGFPGRGEFRAQPGHIIDLMATCVDLAGAKYPVAVGGQAIRPMEGTSLAPAFADRPLPRELLAWEHEGNRAIRIGSWKLVARTGAPWELYNLAADPVELRDLAGTMPDKVKELGSAWDAWARRTAVLPRPDDMDKPPSKSDQKPKGQPR